MRLCMLLILAMVVFSGCDQAKLIQKMTPPEVESSAKRYIELLRQNQFELIEKDLSPEIKSPDIRDTLAQMAKAIPAGKPESVKVVGCQTVRGSGTSSSNITFEYQFQDTWLLINVATQKKDGAFSVVGFNVNPIPDSLENINKFRITGKSLLQYLVLVLAVVVPLFTLYALVLCIRTKMEKKKWLWIIFVLMGVAKLSVDWTTGQFSFSPLSFQVLSAGVLASPYSPWLISVSFPLGAIVFLLKRRTLSKQPVIEVVDGID